MTNETKYTPAPWELCPAKRPNAYHITSESRHWSVACSLETVGCSNPDKDIPDQEALANAHLIAAAPELYSDLQECVNALDAATRLGVRGYEELVLACRETLAKARGETL